MVDGHGDVSHVSRPLKRDEGEFAEWILLDGVSCPKLQTVASAHTLICLYRLQQLVQI